MTRTMIAALLATTALTIAACGSTSPVIHAVDVNIGMEGPTVHQVETQIPDLRVQDVESAPIRRHGFDGSQLRVGHDAMPRHPLVNVADEWGGREDLFYGTRHEHIDSTQLVSHLQAVTESGLRTFGHPPTLHIGLGPEHRQSVLRALQEINHALPPEWHIRVGGDIPGPSTYVPSNRIYIDVGNADDFNGFPAGAAGVAHLHDNHDGSRRSGQVQIALDRTGWHDSSDDILLEKVIVHEILHVLGFDGHSDRQDSRMFDTTLGRSDPTTILFPVDRAALHAIYSRLEPGDTHYETNEKLFGSWNTVATHLVRKENHSSFGVSRQEIGKDDGPSLVHAWAIGDSPSTTLGNSELQGEVTWSGDLIGVRPEYTTAITGDSYATVTGNAEITVDLDTLQGNADFTDLEAWATIVPGYPGTAVQEDGGVIWGDGELSYAIEIQGNTFHRLSGDDGHLTGIFAGPQHQEATGTLERADLSAAFGASMVIEECDTP